MKIENITVKEALERSQTVEFAYIREFSRVAIGNMPIELDLSELLEARFFNQDTELRIFNDGEQLSAVCISNQPDDLCIEEVRELSNPKLFGNDITVRHYLVPDEDGQMYVAQTCLVSWRGEKANG